jgi:hypothetical protein
MGFADQAHQHEGADITAAAFGDIYDMSDGAKPIAAGGGHDEVASGDTWYSTWGHDDSAYSTQDDGRGFNNVGGLFARHRLCRLDGNPNVSTDGFFGVNLNPGLLGNTMPYHVSTPEWRIGYSSSIHEQDGVLYEIRHDWSANELLWPPIDSSIMKSTDGGRNWVNHLGQTNAWPDKAQSMFKELPWSWLTFIQYGKGGVVPGTDNTDRYVYLTSNRYMVRILRAKLANLDKNDFEYYKGGGLDGMLDSSWSRNASDGKPSLSRSPGDQLATEEGGIGAVVYNFGLGRYVAGGSSTYVAPGESGQNKEKVRFHVYTAPHPWGPWQQVVAQGIWGRAGWNVLMCNKFTTSDGKKMWYAFCGEYKGDLWNYGYQYMPLYLSSGAVDRYEAEMVTLQGTHAASDYPSHSGSGYATGFAKIGDGITFAIDRINGAGWHILRIRYTSPKINGNTLSVYVNGKKAKRVKLSLNGDNGPNGRWIDRGDIYYLKDGVNTFEIRQDEGDDGTGVMIDYIAVSREQTYNEGINVAPQATATTSSGDAACAIKGCVDGMREWSAKGTAGEWIKLDWASAQTVQKVILYDEAGTGDQVTSGTLSFSDGSSVRVGKLQNDGQAGNVVTFPPKTIQWVKFTVESVRPSTQHAGLGEIQVYAEGCRP